MQEISVKRFSFTAAAAVAALTLAGCAGETTTAPENGAPSFAAGTADGENAGTYLVRFKGKGVPAEFAGQVTALGGDVIFAHAGVGIAAVSGLDDAGADQLATMSDVAAVDADAYTTIDARVDGFPEASEAPESPANPALAAIFPRQWNMRAVSAPAAWSAGKLGEPAVKVAILDTGIDYLSADLYGRVDLVLSRSFLSDTENARVQTAFPGAHPIADLNYHGTHVAATVASNGHVAAGVTSGITLIGLKVCAPGNAANGWRGTCPTSGTLAAILFAADNGVHVINMSLGGTFNRRAASARGGFGPSFIATINQVMNYANQKGTTVVVSAGNSALDIDHDGNGYKSYCSAPTVICVSATGPTATAGTNGPWTNVDALAGYSNFGRSGISVAAPGGNAASVSAVCSGFSLAFAVCQSRFYNPATGAWSTFTLGASGTSMAAPHVTGLAALIAGEVGRNPAQIRARIQQGADDLGQSGTDPAYGKGRINVAGSLGI